jgi:hypothetical protein
MEQGTKLDCVIKAILEAKSITPKGHIIRVYISQDNGLAAIYPEELKQILLKLQDDERILKIESFPDWLLATDKLTHDILNQVVLAELDPSRNRFEVTTLKNFDGWCARYRAKSEPPSKLAKEWATTNVRWEVKKIIWQSWARGETIKQTLHSFELHQGEREYEGAPFDKKTVGKVREELRNLPYEMAITAVEESPELRSLMERETPNFRGGISQRS